MPNEYPQTPRAKRALHEAQLVADKLGDGYVGLEHYFAGCLSLTDGALSILLPKIGLSLEFLRERFMTELLRSRQPQLPKNKQLAQALRELAAKLEEDPSA